MTLTRTELATEFGNGHLHPSSKLPNINTDDNECRSNGLDDDLLFETTAADLLNERSEKPWNVYVKVIRKYFEADAPAAARSVLAKRLENGLFAQLRLDHKIDLCKFLLEQGQEHADVVSVAG